MATKVVKVKAHKRLDGAGKIENVDAHTRKIEGQTRNQPVIKNSGGNIKIVSGKAILGKYRDMESANQALAKMQNENTIWGGSISASLYGDIKAGKYKDINLTGKK